MAEMKATWKVIIPPASGPKKMNNLQHRQHLLDHAARHRRSGADRRRHQAIINIVKTGYAVHISRLSASGRYLFVIGRDAKINMIDLWMEKPTTWPRSAWAWKARSVDTSKFKGFEDKLAIAGSYWPPRYVIMNGDTWNR